MRHLIHILYTDSIENPGMQQRCDVSWMIPELVSCYACLLVASCDLVFVTFVGIMQVPPPFWWQDTAQACGAC